MGRAKLYKTWIQLSADGWACTPSLLFCLRRPNPGVYKLYGGVNGDPKRTYAKGHLPGLLFPGPHDKPLLNHTSTEDPPIRASLVQSPMGSLLFSLGSWCTQAFVCALQEWNLLFPQSCRSLVIKSCSPSKAVSLDVPSPFARYPGWEAWREAQNLHNSGRTSLVVLFSGSWATYLVGVGLDFILFVPLLPSRCSFLFVFGRGYLFWLGSSIFLSMLVQQLLRFSYSHRRWAHVLLLHCLEPSPALP